MTPEHLEPQIRQHIELMEYMERNSDLPVDFPFCSLTNCNKVAYWAVQAEMEDPSSTIGFMCSGHFTSLPPHPYGRFYRIFKLSVRNYRNLMQKAKDLTK